MARITMEVTTPPGVNPDAVQAWVGDGLALERSSPVGEDQEGSQEEQPEQRMHASAPAGTNGAAPPATTRKTGRKTIAERAAERTAAEAGASTTQPEQVNVAAPPGAQPISSFSAPASGAFFTATMPPGTAAFPPGIMPPSVPVASPAPASPAVVQQQPIPAAMPRSEPLPPPADGVMRLEDFRAANMQFQKAWPGKMNMLMKAPVWPSDNSAKEMWFTVEGVPAEQRMRLVEELQAQQGG